LCQHRLEGASADGQDGVADLELGVAEGRGPAGDQEARKPKDVFAGGREDKGSEFLGVGFLLGGEGIRHGSL
jgi:hypothetical protein